MGKNPVTKTVDFDQNTKLIPSGAISFVFSGSQQTSTVLFVASDIAVNNIVMVRGSANQDGSIKATGVRVAPNIAVSFFKKHVFTKKTKGN